MSEESHFSSPDKKDSSIETRRRRIPSNVANGFLISAGIDRTGEYIWIRDDANRTKFLENFISVTKNVTVD